jgi:hypothetical protein
MHNYNNKIKTISSEKNHKKYNTLNLENNIFSPIESYYSSRVQPRFRNTSLNNYNIKTFNRNSSKENYKKTLNFNTEKFHERKGKSQEQYFISNINFVLLSSNKKNKKENKNNNHINNGLDLDNDNKNKDVKITLNKYILSDLNNSEQNLNYLRKNDENLDYEIPVSVLDNGNEKNLLQIDYPRSNKNINTFITENENSNTQTKSNTIKCSFIQKVKGVKNIKRELLREEIKNNYISPMKYNENQKKTIYSFFRKFDMKTKIKLPNFSWILNNKKEKESNKNLKKIPNNKYNIIKRNNNYLKTENNTVRNNNNIKIIDSKDLYKIQRGENKLDHFSNSKRYFQQSEIYYKLTHLKK